MKPQHFTYKNVEQAAKRGVKGVFMEGEKEIPGAAEDDMMEVFNKTGLPYKFIVNKSIGHWFPEDLDVKLEESLKFILG